MRKSGADLLLGNETESLQQTANMFELNFFHGIVWLCEKDMLSHMAMTHTLKILPPPPVWCLPRPVVPDVRLFCANPPLA